jgi:hypothetical protein
MEMPSCRKRCSSRFLIQRSNCANSCRCR